MVIKGKLGIKFILGALYFKKPNGFLMAFLFFSRKKRKKYVFVKLCGLF